MQKVTRKWLLKVRATRTSQRIFRGKAARKELQEQQDAATKMQAVQRGKVARKELQEGGTVAPAEDDVSFTGTEEEVAAEEMQAVQRGKAARKAMDAGVEETAAVPAEAAVPVKEVDGIALEVDDGAVDEAVGGAMEAPLVDPCSPADDIRYDGTEEAVAAASRIQAMQRGKAARKELREGQGGTTVLVAEAQERELRAALCEVCVLRMNVAISACCPLCTCMQQVGTRANVARCCRWRRVHGEATRASRRCSSSRRVRGATTRCFDPHGSARVLSDVSCIEKAFTKESCPLPAHP